MKKIRTCNPLWRAGLRKASKVKVRVRVEFEVRGYFKVWELGCDDGWRLELLGWVWLLTMKEGFSWESGRIWYGGGWGSKKVDEGDASGRREIWNAVWCNGLTGERGA